MRRRRTFLIVFAILLVILIGGVAALVLMSGGGGGPVPGPTPGAEVEPVATLEPEMEPVVVIVQPVRRGQRIPHDAVDIRRWEVTKLPSDPVYAVEDVIGGYAAVDLDPHRPLRAKEVKRVVLEGSNVSLAIPPGKVGYSVPVRLVAAVAGALKPGDRVDVLISWKVVDVDQDLQIKLPVLLVGEEDCLAGCQPTGEQLPGLVSQYTVQNALVLGVDIWDDEQSDLPVVQPGEDIEEEPAIPVVEGEEEAAPEEAAPPVEQAVSPYSLVSVVTLAVDPQSALVLKWSLESNSSIDLALRSAVDLEEFAQPEAVTLEYMVNRYQISLPPKLPHAPENEFEYSVLKAAEEAAQAATAEE
jgi:Flp pilus assembly protein CpaB